MFDDILIMFLRDYVVDMTHVMCAHQLAYLDEELAKRNYTGENQKPQVHEVSLFESVRSKCLVVIVPAAVGSKGLAQDSLPVLRDLSSTCVGSRSVCACAHACVYLSVSVCNWR